MFLFNHQNPIKRSSVLRWDKETGCDLLSFRILQGTDSQTWEFWKTILCQKSHFIFVRPVIIKSYFSANMRPAFVQVSTTTVHPQTHRCLCGAPLCRNPPSYCVNVHTKSASTEINFSLLCLFVSFTTAALVIRRFLFPTVWYI